MRKSDTLMDSCCAVIFCGGRATRVQSVLDELPKALIPLDKTPYLDGLLKILRVAGIKKVVLCVSPFTSSISTYVGNGSRFNLDVRYSVDDGNVENAGALWAALPLTDTSLMICINGDTVVDVDFQNLVRTHVWHRGVATLVGSTRDDQPHPGAIEVGADGWVKGIYEFEQDEGKSVDIPSDSIRMSNSGVYVFDKKRLHRHWPSQHRVGKLEQGLLRLLAWKRLLWAFPNGDRYLLDLGTEARLQQARSDINQIGSFFLS